YDTRTSLGGEDGVSVTEATVPGIFCRDCQGDGIDLHILRIILSQGLEVLACNGEMLGEWVPEFERVTKGTVVLSGYMAGEALYVPMSAQLPEGGYEVDAFKSRFGLEGGFNPDITQMVLSAA